MRKFFITVFDPFVNAKKCICEIGFFAYCLLIFLYSIYLLVFSIPIFIGACFFAFNDWSKTWFSCK